MSIVVIVQPFRFEILEEAGCADAFYSYVAYVVGYTPRVMSSFGCVVLARKSFHSDGYSDLTSSLRYVLLFSSNSAYVFATPQRNGRVLVERPGLGYHT